MVAGSPLVNCVCMLISGAYEHYSAVVPQIMEGDTDLLENLVNQHASHIMEFNNLRSRSV